MKHRKSITALVAGIALSGGVMATLSAVAPQDEKGITDKVATTRAALEKLTEIQKTISAEKRDWLFKKQLIEGRMDLIQREIETLEKKTADSKAKIAEADKSTVELAAKLEKLQGGKEVLVKAIVELEGRVRALAARMPSVAREGIESILQSMPAEGAETKLGLAARYSFVAGSLKMLGKFHQEVLVKPEVRVAADGRSVAVTTVYFGCGQAFYCDDNGSIAGIGTASAGEWTWIPKNEAAEAIKTLLEIARGKKTAELVAVPVRVQ